MHPLVSVIITTKNEERNIENCLRSVANQTYKNIEIIVVDNNSTDATKQLAHRYTSKVFDKGPERSAQRNFGVTQSSGEYILYLDADMILTSHVVESCINAISADAAVFGIYIPEKVMGNGFWLDVRRFERSFYDGTVVDACRFWPKAIFEKIGGFDETLCGPEDWDFDKRIRQQGKTLVISDCLLHNEGGFEMQTYLNKKSYYATNFDGYIKKWGKYDPDIRKQLGIYYRFFGIFIENNKIYKLFAHPILTIAMYYLRFRVGLRFLMRN